MYLFSRSVRLGPGNPETQLGWALKMTEKVNQISEMPVRLWTKVFSPGSGSLVWTLTVGDLATLEGTFDKLTADAGYTSLVEEGASHVSGDPVEDSLLQIIHADPKSADIDPKYALSIRATLAPGGAVKGVELGVEVAQLASRITGTPTSFGRHVTGTYGQVQWISTYASIAELQSAGDATAADATFSQKVDQELSTVYLPGEATQEILRRVV